jgi:protein-S-isoprenylcysteine O-methyltransferase Ste14
MAIQLKRTGSVGVAGLNRLGPAPVVALVVLLTAAAGAQAVVLAAQPHAIERWLLLPEPARYLGLMLSAASTLAMFWAQLSLGNSWRIGIEAGARPGLITSGPYRVCRNPIFLFGLTALFGYAMALPTWLSFASLAVDLIAIRFQVANEERWLDDSYGVQFRAWARQVGRFTPWTGRLQP